MEPAELIARLANQYSTTKDNVRECIKLLEKKYDTVPKEDVLAALQCLIPSASDGTYPPLPMSPVKPVKRKRIVKVGSKLPESYREIGECFSCFNPLFETNTFPPYVCIAAKDPKEQADPLTLAPSARTSHYVVSCPSCESKVCVHDLEGFYTSNKVRPKCINSNCNIEFDVSVLRKFIPPSYLPIFRKILKTAIYEEELSQLPLTEASVAVGGYATLGTTRLTISGELAARSKTVENKIKLKKLPMKCLIDGCPGIIDEVKWKCDKCGKKKCKKCKEYKADKKHVCDPYVLSLIAEERMSGCTCPGCGAIWQKTEGCDHMWCISCHAHYNYVKGGVGKPIPKSEQTNGAWREYQRMKMALKASKAGISTVQNLVLDAGECPQDNIFPNHDTIIRHLYDLFGGLDEEVYYLLAGVHRLSSSNDYGFPVEGYQRVLHEESVSMEREFIILARDRVKINIDAVMPQIHDIQGHLEQTRKFDTFKGYIGTTIPANILDMNSRTYKVEECNKLFRERAFKFYKKQLYARRYLDIANMFRASAIIIFKNIMQLLQPLLDVIEDNRQKYAEAIYVWRAKRGLGMYDDSFPSDEERKEMRKDSLVVEKDGNINHHPNLVLDNRKEMQDAVIVELKSLVDLIKQTNKFFKDFCEAHGESKHPYITHNLEFYIPSHAHAATNRVDLKGTRHGLWLNATNTVKILDIEKWEVPDYTKKDPVHKSNILEAIGSKKFTSVSITVSEDEGKNTYYLTPSTINIFVSNDFDFIIKIFEALQLVSQKLTGSFYIGWQTRHTNDIMQRKMDMIANFVRSSRFKTIELVLLGDKVDSIHNIDDTNLTNFVNSITSRQFKKITLWLPSVSDDTCMWMFSEIAKKNPVALKGSSLKIDIDFDRFIRIGYQKYLFSGQIRNEIARLIDKSKGQYIKVGEETLYTQSLKNKNSTRITFRMGTKR